jgi:hypothetical protein
MEFLITEKQFRTILSESKFDKFSNAMKTLNKFTIEMVEKVGQVYGLNLKMFLTFGTSVGGLVLPLDNYIKTGKFEVTEDQKILILAGVCFILLFEGKKGINRILNKIKKENLEKEFNIVLTKGYALKQAFLEFMNTIKESANVILEAISYTFLIPIITDIADLAHKTKNVQQVAQLIAERLISSGVVLMGKEILTAIIKRIINRFK